MSDHDYDELRDYGMLPEPRLISESFTHDWWRVRWYERANGSRFSTATPSMSARGLGGPVGPRAWDDDAECAMYERLADEGASDE